MLSDNNSRDFFIIVLTLFFLVCATVIGCHDPSSQFSEVQDSKTEAEIFRNFASGYDTYEIQFFDIDGDKVHYSGANKEVLNSVLEIRIKLPNGTTIKHQVLDNKNIELLLGE